MKVFLVSHTHWDREWYRSFESFRGRLVDAVDRVLDLVAEDPGFHFVLDGQIRLIEDYLEIRPQRRAELVAACRAGRIAIGPWYVQPDSLLPAGETHLRNLLEARSSASLIGELSGVGYTPDSFGHPAQLPQILAGFGLNSFVHWRGNGSELDQLPSEYRWVAPDGSSVLGHVLLRGYFSAAALPRSIPKAVERLRELAETLAKGTRGSSILMMNGIDHAAPDPHTAEVAKALAQATGWEVERGLLDDFVATLSADAPEYRGELVGARLAHLLPGVWSARMPQKLRNRACENALLGWAEPWSALGSFLGLTDERPALREAWRALLLNQAHDSLCGCSIDVVHEQMEPRFDRAQELACETRDRVLERLAGEREPGNPPPQAESQAGSFNVAVFNPHPHRTTGIVRFELNPFPVFPPGEEGAGYHPLLAGSKAGAGFSIDGEPARCVPGTADGRFLLATSQRAIDVEFVARDVPAFGWRSFRLERGPASEDALDDGDRIGGGEIRVRAADDGTFEVSLRDRTYSGLAGLEDQGDRGDTYDADPIDDRRVELVSVERWRTRHASGIETLRTTRILRVPRRLAKDRDRRSAETCDLELVLEARIAPGIEHLELEVTLENRAEDHRLRLLFPTGGPLESFHAATTFDAALRSPGPLASEGWVHAAPASFVQQGWIAANGLTLVAPGLPEAEVRADGTILLTLVRSVGWLSREDLRTRPGPAGPALPVPGAQCLGRIRARLAVFAGYDPRRARAAELPLRAVLGGASPLLAPGRALLELESRPAGLLLSALKPVAKGEGAVLRVLNPSGELQEARVRLGFDVRSASAVRLDETTADFAVALEGNELRFEVPPHALRSVWLQAG